MSYHAFVGKITHTWRARHLDGGSTTSQSSETGGNEAQFSKRLPKGSYTHMWSFIQSYASFAPFGGYWLRSKVPRMAQFRKILIFIHFFNTSSNSSSYTFVNHGIPLALSLISAGGLKRTGPPCTLTSSSSPLAFRFAIIIVLHVQTEVGKLETSCS